MEPESNPSHSVKKHVHYYYATSNPTFRLFPNLLFGSRAYASSTRAVTNLGSIPCGPCSWYRVVVSWWWTRRERRWTICSGTRFRGGSRWSRCCILGTYSGSTIRFCFVVLHVFTETEWYL